MISEERFTVLYRAHYAALRRYALRRIGQDAAGDVVAETFLVAWRRRADVPADPSRVLPWLYGVAGNVLADARRSQNRRDRLAARLWAEPAAEAGDLAGGVAAELSVHRALRTLSPDDQEILRLVGWEELDLTDLATALACSKKTASVRLYRARRRLEAVLTRTQDKQRSGQRLAPGGEW